TCKEQQVQLSLTAKNRKGPASSSTVLTDREPLLGMPGRCCSECPFSPQRQKPKEQPGSARKQSSHSPSAATHQTRDCASEASSMGSELDEADNEVKWFTDLAFKSLSSPQVDYLDIYNSSYRSSANASRPSTGESCGANVWSAYADLRGSSRTDGNDVIAPDSKEPAEQFEMGNFECEDVALESKDELKRGKRTVPKRQIQLKRRDTSESRASESSESECKPTHRSSERRTQDILLRQHSTPAAIQDGYHKTEDVTIRQDNKKKLQKSVSLDETSSKTKFASCLIKNVLSKKMLYEHKLKQLQSSGVKSDCSLSSEELSLEPLLPGKLELSNQNVTDTSNIILNTTVSAKTHQKPCCKYSFNAFENCVEGAANTKSSNGKQGKRSELVIPCEKRKACTDEGIMKDEAEHNASDNPGQQWRDSASSSTTGRVDVISTARPTRSKSGRTDKEEQHPVNTEKCQQQDPRAIFKSEAPEITLKPNTNDKVWTTLRVACLSPDKETGKVGNGESLRPVSTPGVDQEKNKESDLVETTSYNKGKTLIHKVRDVRKLVKNTYNLSFKAPAAPPQEKGGENNMCVSSGANQGKRFYFRESQDHREREISTLLVLKDGPEETPAAGCLPSSSSHSVSMILKEKGFQADIGVCETSSEDSNSAPKHVNTLEVPLQTCVLKSTGLESGRMETPAEADLPLPQSQTPADLLPPECQAAASDASKEQLTDECSHKSTQDSILQPESRSYGEFSQDLYASDDPPSYDERESFSRLLATDLPPGKPDKYCPAPPKCSCSVATQKSPAPLPSPPAPSPASAWCDSETPESQQAMTSQTQRTDTSALNHPAFPLQAGQMNPRGFLSPFAAECGSEGLPYPGNVASSAVPCFQYNQSPRKVLLDPETGKYFYIDMPVQPLRKMLYDPETGQYVEVLIPQQALSHSGVYQNPASPYSSFMNPGMYSSPYMPYSGLPMPSHPALPPGHP
uniref:Spermatogenesis-associated protein 24-like n=1 Tax=Lepisosteus oculatus TaxID=7918 RepID=W5N489_LEPOC